jgi:hypothetical protein
MQIPSYPSLMENLDKEGEVDKMKEDIKKLYDESDDHNLSLSENALDTQTQEVMIKEKESDKVPNLVDDVDDSMFGDE